MGKRTITTNTEKAKLVLSVARMEKQLRKRLPKKTRVGKSRVVFLTGFIESLMKQYLEMANEERKNMKPERQRINVQHMARVAIREDQPLQGVLSTRVAGEYVH